MGRESPGFDPSLPPAADDGEATRTYLNRAAPSPVRPADAPDQSPHAPTEVLPHPPTEVAAPVTPPAAEPPRQNQDIVRYGPGVPATPPPGQAELTAERAWHGTGPARPPPRRRQRWRRLASAALTIALLAASAVVLYLRFHHPPFQVTGVAITHQASKRMRDGRDRADQHQWLGRNGLLSMAVPSGQQSPQPLNQSVAAGQTRRVRDRRPWRAVRPGQRIADLGPPCKSSARDFPTGAASAVAVISRCRPGGAGDYMPEWKVPGYTELKALGSGGFGDVMLARHDPTGTLVAIKYLRRDLWPTPNSPRMFRGEATVLAVPGRPERRPALRIRRIAVGCRHRHGTGRRRPAARDPDVPGQDHRGGRPGGPAGLAARPGRGAPARCGAPGLQTRERPGQRRRHQQADRLRHRGPRRRPPGPGGHPGCTRRPSRWPAPRPARPATSTRPPPPSTSASPAARPSRGDTAELCSASIAPSRCRWTRCPNRCGRWSPPGWPRTPQSRPTDATTFVTELNAAASRAYGRHWHDRGRSHLAEAALLLAALWPSGPPPSSTGHHRAPASPCAGG